MADGPAPDPARRPSAPKTPPEVDPVPGGGRGPGPAASAAAPPRSVWGRMWGSRRTGTEERGRQTGAGGALSFLKELPVLLVVAFGLALLIKTFLVQAFFIPSESMEPTLQVGDRVLVNKVVYRLHPPQRGDIIVFEDPHPTGAQEGGGPLGAFWRWLTQGLGVATAPERDFIKRVVGLPGDVVEVKRGVVFINGRRLEEPYLNPLPDTSSYPPTRVPPNSLFVMGDNRVHSNDSRRGLGMIPYDRVVGKAFVLIWPPSRIGLIRSP
jgi:signal peptidase I